MKKRKYTFLSEVKSGNIRLEDIDVWLDKWYDSDMTCSLREYLGMSENQYRQWLENPQSLKDICSGSIK